MVDLSSLWDFANPALSEQRFREALVSATGDDALILQTQLARTFGLRRDFATAQELLKTLEPEISAASPEAQVRYFLELGRAHASAAHAAEAQTPETKQTARESYTRAFELAKASQLDYLAVDALHMMAFVDTEPHAQLDWDQKALAYMEQSSQAEAHKWEASLRNNVGFALHQLGRYDDALAHFRLALAALERTGKPESIRVAHWMVAWTLRAKGELQEALAIQLRLEQECAAAGVPDPYVFEELEHLYRALDQPERAEFYADLPR